MNKEPGNHKQPRLRKPTRGKSPPRRQSKRANAGEAIADGDRQATRQESLLEQFTDITSQVTSSALELAKAATAVTALEGGSWLWDTYRKSFDPERLQAMADAGHFLRDAREVAGMNIEDLATALGMKDASLLEDVEEGRKTLPLETIFRIASLIARHDPIPFIIRFLRTYNPRLGATLEQWGIAALPRQYERERRFINIYRQHDELRTLSDAEHARFIDYIASATSFALEVLHRERSIGSTGGTQSSEPT